MTKGRGTNTVLAQQLLAGAKKHLSSVSSLTLEGAPLTPAQLEASLQTLLDLRTDFEDARGTAKAKLVTEATLAPPLRSRMAAFVMFVRASFGTLPDVLADFGLKPKKATTPLTIDQKAAAAAKRAATRAARHTMGKKQKKAVKGTITTITTIASTPISPSPPIGSSSVADRPSQGGGAGTAPRAAP